MSLNIPRHEPSPRAGAGIPRPHTHEVKEKPISIRRGEGGGAVRGGPLWSPAVPALAFRGPEPERNGRGGRP